ncbi:MAG: hypothetical protein M3R38_16195 [Actinomycetota bacterium]|nr:hypothetical protein [Actinomycetota bacterium]
MKAVSSWDIPREQQIAQQLRRMRETQSGGNLDLYLEVLSDAVKDRVWEKLFPHPSLEETSFTLFLRGLGMDARDMWAILDVKHTHEAPMFNDDRSERLKTRLVEMRKVLAREIREAEPELPSPKPPPEPGPGRGHKADSTTTRFIDRGASYTLRRLKRDHQDLAEKVVSGEISANAAAIEAGFRKKTITVPADLDGAMDALVKRFGADACYEMARQKFGRGSEGSRA